MKRSRDRVAKGKPLGVRRAQTAIATGGRHASETGLGQDWRNSRKVPLVDGFSSFTFPFTTLELYCLET